MMATAPKRIQASPSQDGTAHRAAPNSVLAARGGNSVVLIPNPFSTRTNSAEPGQFHKPKGLKSGFLHHFADNALRGEKFLCHATRRLGVPCVVGVHRRNRRQGAGLVG